MKLFNVIYWLCLTFGKATNSRDAMRQFYEKKGVAITELELDKFREAEALVFGMSPYIRESLIGFLLFLMAFLTICSISIS